MKVEFPTGPWPERRGMDEDRTTRRTFLAAAGAVAVAPLGCASSSGPTRTTAIPAVSGPLKSITALGDSLSDTGFFPHSFPRWLPQYFPSVRVTSLGEAGDDTATVLGRCWRAGIVNYLAAIRKLGGKPNPVPPGQYCSVLVGVNDLIYRSDDSAQIVSNLTKIYEYLRRHHSVPFPITILPWGRSPLFRADREGVRLAVNRWIRAQPLAVDVEQLMGDGRKPPALKPAFAGPDGIHPVRHGPQVLARAVAQRMLAFRAAHDGAGAVRHRPRSTSA